MRGPARAILFAAALVPLAGCQTGFDEGKENARPLKVDHALGETKVPGLAKRPLALTDGALDAVLALGVRPAAAALPGGRAPAYLARRAPGLKVLPPVTRATLRAARATRPDVILGSQDGQGRLYKRLDRVAPTVLSDDGGGPGWKLDLRLFGEALGRTNQAEGLLTRWDARAARARRVVRRLSAGRTLAVVRVVRGGLREAGGDSFAGHVLAHVGVPGRRPAGAFRRLAPGRAARVRASTVLLSVAPGAGSTLAALGASGSWPGRHEVVRVDDAVWWGGDGLWAAREALAELERALAGLSPRAG